MNWGLLLRLSAFGFVMAIATISFIPIGIEPILWLVIFGFCAYSIAKNCKDRYFFHGFMLSIINCIFIVAFHVAFWDTYSAAHSDMVASFPKDINPRMISAASGPIFGVLSGIVQGLMCVAASKMMKKT